MTTITTTEAADNSVATVSPSSPPENADTNSQSISNEDSVVDPRVTALQAMFPDFDTTILQSVLESVSGDQDRAIDVLLGMSDPSYQSAARPDAAQTDLDEEFARNLMLEEQSRHQATWRPQYENAPSTAQTQQNPENDSVAQFQEQLGKFAESSKRTLGTLFSKVKAKIQDLDNPTNEPAIFAAPRQPVAFQPQPQPQPQLESQPASQLYQATLEPAGSAAETGTHRLDTPQHVSPNDDLSMKPPSVPLNPSAIGLYPKRPVTLESSPQPSNVGANDDDLEYVTNPFEESERK